MTLNDSPIYLSLAEGVIKMKKSTYIKILLILFAMSVFSFNTRAKEELIKSQWLNSIVNIDGSLEDWSEIGVYLDKRVMTECALRNNNETLFILFVLKDRKYFSTIQTSGLTIWFNSDGTKKKNDGLHFLNKMISAADYIAGLEQQKGPLSEEDKIKILENPSYVFHQVELITKNKEDPSQQDRSEEARKSVFRTGNQKGKMVYEFAIPLSLFPDSVRSNILKVGFEWGGMTDEYRKRLRDRQAESQNRFGEKQITENSAGNPSKYLRWVDVQLSEKK
jgi:hypothetical protein